MTTIDSTGLWLTCPYLKPDAQLRLVCFPFAGGGAWVFRDWAKLLPASVELHAVQLPGRERRIREASCTSMAALADGVAEALAALAPGPTAFFGHSMGAVLAFEVARRLREAGRFAPVHLVASGHRAPDLPDPDPPIHDLPEPQFLEALRDLNGTPPEVFESPELLELVIPTLRADFAVCETYAFREDEPLTCPITAYGGHDDPDVDLGSLRAWGRHTTGGFTTRMFPGDHFFLQSTRPQVIGALGGLLEQVMAARRS